MSRVFKLDLIPTHKLILLKMCDRANDEGRQVFEGLNTIAKCASCSRSTVKNAIRDFKKAGIVSVQQEGGKGPKSTNHYHVHIDVAEAVYRPTEEAAEGDAKGSTVDPLEPNKGSTVDPLEPKRGQLTSDKGSTALTPIHQEDSSRTGARAREGETDDPPRALACDHWRACADRLAMRIGAVEYRSWLEPCVPISDNGETLVLGCPTKLSVDWIERDYLDALISILKREIVLEFHDWVGVRQHKARQAARAGAR